MKRGWTSQDLPVIENDDTLWTIADAARLLGPLPNDPATLPAEATMTKLRILTRFHRLQPQGKRRTSPPGHPGRYARVYHAADFIDLYDQMDRFRQAPPAAA